MYFDRLVFKIVVDIYFITVIHFSKGYFFKAIPKLSRKMTYNIYIINMNDKRKTDD